MAAGVLATIFTVVASLLALWSLWWFIKAAKTNPGEREAEVEARERVARGEGWEEGSGPTDVPCTDAELAKLSDALAAQSLEEAGIDARSAPPVKRRGFLRR